MVATSSDPLLLNWTKVTGGPVIPMAKDGETLPYRVFDPCIWRQGDHYYALSAGQIPGRAGRHAGGGGFPVPLGRPRTLGIPAPADRRGPLHAGLGDDGACPYFWPIGDKHMLLFFSHMSGGQYLLGDYDTARQKLDVTGAGKFNMGAVGPGGVHAPSATPDGRDIVVIFNMNPGKPTAGWNQIMSLPRRLSLGDHDELRMAPVAAVESCRARRIGGDPRELPANEEVVFDTLRGDALEIQATVAPEFGVHGRT